MGVIDYTDITSLTPDMLPEKLVDADSPVPLTGADVTGPNAATNIGLKVNAVIQALDVIGSRVNQLIDTTAEVGTRENQLIRNVNWLGHVFEGIELIGQRRYLAYTPGETVPEGPDGGTD